MVLPLNIVESLVFLLPKKPKKKSKPQRLIRAADQPAQAVGSRLWHHLLDQTSEWPLIPKLTSALWGLLVILGVLTVVVINAWVGDDAAITIAVMNNFVDGWGFVINQGERVQAFTHPLWALVIGVILWSGLDIYYAIIGVSGLLVMVATAVLLRLASCHEETKTNGFLKAAVLGLVLVSSVAFIDYGTSGLENPLGYGLFAAFFWLLRGSVATTRDYGKLAFVGVLLVLTRFDYLILVLPVLLALVTSHEPRQRGKLLIGALLAMGSWNAFSWFYFGFPLPMSYYAKIPLGISQWDYLVQASQYYLYSLQNDLVTLVVIAGGLWVCLSKRQRLPVAIALGVCCYLAYIAKVGGDFMAGRFFAIPFWVSLLACTVYWRGQRLAYLLVAGVVVGNGWGSAKSPLFNPANAYKESFTAHSGIVDERAWYFAETGLLAVGDSPVISRGHFADYPATRQPQRVISLCGGLGGKSLKADPRTYIMDYCGIGSPFLAMLPAAVDPEWRIGHLRRHVPAGYVESIGSGENRIEDEKIAAYYDLIHQIITGELWSWQRLLTALKFNFGAYSDLVAHWQPLFGSVTAVAALPNKKPMNGLGWTYPGSVLLTADGARFRFASPVNFARLELSLSDHNSYDVSYYYQGKPLGTQVVRPSEVKVRMMRRRHPAMRDYVLTKGEHDRPIAIDEIKITPQPGSRHMSLGRLLVTASY